ESEKSREALGFVRDRLAATNIQRLQQRLAERERRDVPVPVLVHASALEAAEQPSAFSFTSLVPLILILMTITGAVYPAIDVTAGERERGTLEMLMAAPMPRVGLLLAKYVAVVTVAVLTALMNLAMMLLTVWLSGLSGLLFGPDGLSAGVVLAVFALLLLFAAVFSAGVLVLNNFGPRF